MFMPDASKKPGPWPERFNIPASVPRDQMLGSRNIPRDQISQQTQTANPVARLNQATNTAQTQTANPVTRLNQATNTAQTQTTPGNTNLATVGRLASLAGQVLDPPRAGKSTHNPRVNLRTAQLPDDDHLRGFLSALA